MAQSSPAAVVRAVHDLAVRRGWRPVENLATDILSARGAEQILLAPGASVDATPLREWILQVTAAERVAQCPISRVATAPHPALFASKLMGVFDCGCLLEAAEVKVVLAQFLPRPLESFAIVFMRAERLETREDLQRMERAIWRVLVPAAKTDWRGQDLSTYQCYLWAAGPPRKFLRERCERDRARLAAMLRRPTGAGDAASLDRRRVVRLLDLAAAHVPTAPKRDADRLAGPRQFRDEIAQLRRRLARRLDAGASELSRRAVVALLEVERQLFGCVEATWRDCAPTRNATNGFAAGSTKLLGRLEAQMHSWRTGFEAELSERVNAIVADTRALLQEQMSRAATNCRLERWDPLAAGPGDISLAAFIPRLQYRADTVERPGIPGLIAEATALTAVTGLAALSAGLIATVVVSAVLSASIVVRERKQSLEHSRRVIRRAVHEVAERAVPEVRAAIQESISRYRDRLAGTLREIEIQIEAACERECLAQVAVPASFSDREQLLEYRRRL